MTQRNDDRDVYAHPYLADEEATVSISTNLIFCLLLWWMTGSSSPVNDNNVDISELEMEVIPEFPNKLSDIHKKELCHGSWNI